MDNRISYFNRLNNLDWNIPLRPPKSPPTATRLRALEDQVYVFKALLVVVVPYLVALSLPVAAGEPGGQAPAPSWPLLGPVVVGGVLFWAGVGFLAGRLWWAAYFCGLLALSLTTLYSLPTLESVGLEMILRLAAMGLLIGAACVGGSRSSRW
jgi:hypothetical protein